MSEDQQDPFRTPSNTSSEELAGPSTAVGVQSEVSAAESPRSVQVKNIKGKLGFGRSPFASSLQSGSQFVLRKNRKQAPPTVESSEQPAGVPDSTDEKFDDVIETVTETFDEENDEKAKTVVPPLTIGGVSDLSSLSTFSFSPRPSSGNTTKMTELPYMGSRDSGRPGTSVYTNDSPVVTTSERPATMAGSSSAIPRKPSVFYRRPSEPERILSRPGTELRPSTRETNSTSRRPIRRHFVSRRLPLGYSAEKPWVTSPTRAEKVVRWIIIVSCLIGLGLVGVLTWVGTTEIINDKYCLVMDENFEGTSLSDNWMHEQQLGGFGNGEFEWTTDSTNNSYVKDGKLYIVPTFTADAIGETNMYNGYTVNLTTAGTCTGQGQEACSIRSNASTGTIIPPIQSARLTTINSASIRYGKVEVKARLPKGDWIWPAIWMMPTRSVYGDWPASGEIDIAESRGNDHNYPDGGNNVASSSLHWGPSQSLDQYWRTSSKMTLKRNTFVETFHTFGLEWSDKYIMTYLDGRLRQIIYHAFSSPFWNIGSFSSTYDNGTSMNNPWPPNNKQAPFDQDFYLILNVAVGGTNGFFRDGVAGKPWTNSDRQTAMQSFWNDRSTWQATWGDEGSRAMIVESVKMYSKCG